MSKISNEVASIKSKLTENIGSTQAQTIKIKKGLETFDAQKKEKLQSIDEYFEKLIERLMEHKLSMKKEFTELCESKQSQLKVCLQEYQKSQTKFESAINKIEAFEKELGNLCIKSRNQVH